MKEKEELEKMCAFCEYCSPTYDINYVLCEKKGIVHASYICKKFLYDPLKRTVKKPTLKKDGFDFVDINK